MHAVCLITIILSVLIWNGKFLDSFFLGPEVTTPSNKLLLILLDGFRWDYFGDFTNLPNFERFRFEGVHAEYMRPVFPSLSYPGYYSILTGLFVEKHGFIDNVMYDKKRNMFFTTDTDDNGSMPFWWEQAEPLWTSTQRAGLRTFVYNWPGCHVPIHGHLPFYHQKYAFSMGLEEFEQDTYAVLDRMYKNEADVGIVYCEYPDIIGHIYGPESYEMQRAVERMDASIGVVLDYLDQLQLTNRVNVVMVSDHGMTNVLKMARVDLGTAMEPDDVALAIGSGGLMQITPYAGKVDKVYNSLKTVPNVYVWKAGEIPEELHYKHHCRVPPILVAAKGNVYIYPFPPRDWSAFNLKGHHGWLPSELSDMRAFFMAKGPDLKLNYDAPPINMVDVYNLMNSLLKMKPNPNNGSWENVRHMLFNDNTR